MEEDFPESSLDDELQCSKTEDLRSLQDLNLDTHQDSQIPKLDLHCGRDQDQGQDPPPDLLEGQEVDQNPVGRGRDSVEDLFRAQQSQDQDQDQDQDQKVDPDQDHRADQHQYLDQVEDRDRDQDQDLQPANEQAAVESGGSVPALVITQAEESEEDDSRSVAASSVMSLFHRVQLDPVEKLWLRSSAVGNMLAQRQLLAQDPSLVLKKVRFKPFPSTLTFL
ncbi:uncharacterized protein LOC142941018 [Anarhichas minor]|uniref:uncharacterized protein LOC142941018 n=1 Tax=Anarhichas minor TaxID=65739 RepID=UPI003F7410CA